MGRMWDVIVSLSESLDDADAPLFRLHTMTAQRLPCLNVLISELL